MNSRKIILLSIVFQLFYSLADAQVKLVGNITTNGVANYPTHIDSLGKGGYMSMPTIAARNAIPTLRRKYGMLVFVEADGVIYKLNAATLANVDWVTFSLGATTDVDAGTLTGSTLKSTVTNSSLTSLGTITSGVWNATTIDVAHGGTGLSAIGSANQVLNNNTNSAIVKRDESGNFSAGTITGNLTGNATTAGNITATSNTTLTSLSNLNTVGTITSGVWSGTTIDAAHGGTGATTKSAGFDALSPMTTSGDIIYGGTSGNGTRLGKGSDGQLLTLTSGVPSWANSSSIPYTGATGAVNLGAYDLKVNQLTVGKGGGGVGSSTAIGYYALFNNTSGTDNTAIGYYALLNNTFGRYNTAIGNGALSYNTSGTDNTAIGYRALYQNTTGNYNIAIGNAALSWNITGTYNTAIGNGALRLNTGANNTASGNGALSVNTTGNYNTAIGVRALSYNATGNYNTAIGVGADVYSDNLTNATAIGNGAIVLESNAIQLGNTSVTSVKTSGKITAGAVTYPNTHGTNGQVLSTTGSGTLTWTTTSAPTDASTSAKGIIQLAGDLGGTASLPTVNSIGGVNSSTISNFDTRITGNTNSITSNTADIITLNSNLNNKQNILTAGSGIIISQGNGEVVGDIISISTIESSKLIGTDIETVGTITSGVWSATTIDVAHGGTGATSQQTAINALTGSQISGRYLRSDGTNTALSTIQATDVPTLNQNTSGNAATATTAGNITATSNTTLTSLSNLNTVGTITSGVWSGTIIDILHGGTGTSTQNFVDLSTNQSIAGNKIFNSNDGFVALGNFGLGNPTSIGAGVRMMWTPTKGAFRAGKMDDAQWDDFTKIGNYSTSFGYNNLASGVASTAIGQSTTSSGLGSTALGLITTASGFASSAMGNSTTASGSGSTAMGNSTTASGSGSTAMGNSTTASQSSSTAMGQSTTASGYQSIAMGLSTIASGDISTAMGQNTRASQSVSTAMGQGTTASGFASTAMGQGTTASQSVSTAMGQSTTASGIASTAMGQNTIASGYRSTTMGQYTTASGPQSTAMGQGSTADGNNSTAMGQSTKSSGYESIAMGMYSYASGSQSVAMGQSTIASGDQSTAMGVSSKAIGNASTAMGQSTTASGNQSTSLGSSTIAGGSASTAMGQYTTAGGSASTSMGQNTTANGEVSTAMGQSTTASAFASTAMGLSTTAGGMASTAIGYNASASGLASTAIGQDVIAPSYGETVLGLFNTRYTPIAATSFNSDDRLFVIGNGLNDGTRSNAVTVLKNGNISIKGIVTAGDVTYPNTHGTDGQVLSTTGSGTLTWTTTSAPTDASTSAKGIVQLAGDLGGTASLPTVNTVGGVNSSTISTNNALVTAATNNNTNSTIVKRDGTGSFSAGTITAALTGNVTGNVTGNLTGNATTATLSTNAITAGNITATSNTTLTSLSNLNTVGTITSGVWSGTAVAIANGGTGSATKNFVDLTNAQTVAGVKTFNDAISGSNTSNPTIAGFSVNINTQTTNYTLLASDNGKIINFTNSGAITLTLPVLTAGFNCMIIQSGVGVITLTGSSTTVKNKNSFTKTAGANSIVTIIYLATNSAITIGDMSN